jgi:Flp pilus assembly protein TadG
LSGPRALRQGGQAIVEIAIALPFLVVLLTGLINVGLFAADKVMAGYATRSGDRLASQLGGGGALTQTQVDQQIVQATLASATGLTFVTIQEIDVYGPTNANGVFNSATDLSDSFDGSGTLLHSGFPTAGRDQTPPLETSIGVRVAWRYVPPTGFANTINVQTSDFTVMKAAPLLPQ